MKILFTGSDGFVGKAYCAEARKLGYEILEFDRPQHDILDEADFDVSLSLADMVIHCAAMADVTVCIKRQFETYNTNTHATFRIAQKCADAKKPLIFISTCCAYGNSLDDEEIEFKTAPMCCEPYAVSKVAAEYLIRGIPNLDYVILRLGTIYGENMREALFTYIALNNILRDQTVYIDGTGKQTRQYVHIEDLTDGIIRATQRFNDVKGQIFNLCGIEQTSVIDTIDVAEKIIGKKAVTEHRSDRYGQTFKEHISIENARKHLGWIPKWSFYEGMRQTFHADERFK